MKKRCNGPKPALEPHSLPMMRLIKANTKPGAVTRSLSR